MQCYIHAIICHENDKQVGNSSSLGPLASAWKLRYLNFKYILAAYTRLFIQDALTLHSQQ